MQKEAKENDVVKKPPKTGLLMRWGGGGNHQAANSLSTGCVIGAAKNEATKEGGKPQEVRSL